MVLVFMLFSVVMCVPTLFTILARALDDSRRNPTPLGMLLAVLSLLLGGALSAFPAASQRYRHRIR